MRIELKHPRKELINIKNNDQKEHPERIKKTDKKIACNLLNYDEIKLPVEAKDFKKIELQIIFELMCFVMKMIWFFQFMFQIKNLKNLWIYCF